MERIGIGSGEVTGRREIGRRGTIVWANDDEGKTSNDSLILYILNWR